MVTFRAAVDDDHSPAEDVEISSATGRSGSGYAEATGMDGFVTGAMPPGDHVVRITVLDPEAPSDRGGTSDEGTSAHDDDGDCCCEVAPCAGSAEGIAPYAGRQRP